MTIDSALLGRVRDVDGATIAVEIDPSVPTGLIFSEGEPHSPGQVGSFIKITVGLVHLVAVITRAGAGAAPTPEDAQTASRWVSAQLVGESVSGQGFFRGVARLPNIGDRVRLVTERDLALIYGSGPDERSTLTLGRLSAGRSISARLDINRLVTRHCAIVGSTGSGKSTTVARIAEALTEGELKSSRVVLFDLHGEYGRSLKDRAKTLGLSTTPALYVPFWALTFDELLPLTFGTVTDEAGRAYVRDEIVRLKRKYLSTHPLSGIADEGITADTPVPFSIRELWFDLYVFLNATHTKQSSGQSPATIAYEKDAAGIPIETGNAERLVPPRFATQNLSSDGEKVYLSGAPFGIRRNLDLLLSRLKDARFRFVLAPGPWDPDSSDTEDLDSLLEMWVGGSEQVAVIDLSGVPPTVVQDVIGSMTRILYDAMFWARNLSEGGRERPLMFIFEEAHAYLGTGAAGLAKSSVQRIVREGRKYGVGALIVSQRPSELDPTILSQCGTLISMRLTNASDRQIIARSAADNLDGMFSLLPVLQTGEAILVGEAVALPTRALIDAPSSRPDSQDPLVVGTTERPGGWDKRVGAQDYGQVVLSWRLQETALPNDETRLERQ